MKNILLDIAMIILYPLVSLCVSIYGWYLRLTPNHKVCPVCRGCPVLKVKLGGGFKRIPCPKCGGK